MNPIIVNKTEYQSDMLAFDFAPSKRRKTKDGFLIVEDNRFIKEQVSGYLGREIPNWVEQGLDPDKIYYGYRPAEEIKKAIKSWDGLPLLLGHARESAKNPTRQRIGSVGTSGRWSAPYGINSLAFNEQKGIDAVESGEAMQISPSYRYRPEFVSGVFNGERYDFIMRDLEGNHWAIVPVARGGPDLVVNDSLPMEIKTMDEEKMEEVQNKLEDVEVAAATLAEGASELIKDLHEEKDGEERDITDDDMDLDTMLRNEDYLSDDIREKLKDRLDRWMSRRADDAKAGRVTKVATDEEIKEIEKEKVKIDDRAEDEIADKRMDAKITADDSAAIVAQVMRQSAVKAKLESLMKRLQPEFACDSLTLQETAVKAKNSLGIKCRDSIALDGVLAYIKGATVSAQSNRVKLAMDSKPKEQSELSKIIDSAVKGE